ncbi:hypothetical protein I4U23_006875 [Adineta vaga]|nr:hypothetical protein I4U23_006875 [Adineta vaga]
MSSAFTELLRKSNLDFIVTQKISKLGSRTDEIIIATFIDMNIKKLQLVACLDQFDSSTIWSTSLDERTFQLNARLLDLTELSDTMLFLSERLTESDFTLSRSNNKTESSQLNITFIHSKTKQSITLHLDECLDEKEKIFFLSKILSHIYKRNQQLSTEVKQQELQIKELSTNRISDNKTKLIQSTNDNKNIPMKSKERTQMSLINPSTKRRKAATGINYDDDDSD